MMMMMYLGKFLKFLVEKILSVWLSYSLPLPSLSLLILSKLSYKDMQ